MEVHLSRNFQWQRIGEVLKIRAPLLIEGKWTGLDRKPCFYPADVIQRDAPTVVGKQIKRRHEASAEAVVGFVTAVRPIEKGAEFEGIIFDKKTIDEIELGLVDGVSIEAWVNEDNGVAKKINFTAVAIVEAPACEPCRIASTRTIHLSQSQSAAMSDPQAFWMWTPDGYCIVLPEVGWRLPVGNDTATKIKPIGVMPYGEKEGDALMAEEGLAKPSRAEFFEWLEDQLKKAGVPEDVISKVIDVLKKAIKTPYPYPYPSPVKQSELASSTRTKILRWIRYRLKKMGLKDVDAVMSLIKQAFSEHGVELSLEDELADFEKEIAEKEKAVSERDAKIKELQTRIEELQSKIQEYEEQLAAVKKAEIDEIVKQIREIDSEFDAEKFLEGVEDLDSQKALLEKYLESIKRIAKPQAAKLSVSDANEVEAKVKKALEEMGISDLSFILER